jgi:hypothetical protein
MNADFPVEIALVFGLARLAFTASCDHKRPFRFSASDNRSMRRSSSGGKL